MNYEYEINELKEKIKYLENVLKLKETNSNSQTQRDKTKYILNGKIYPKNRLVLAVIKDYVEKQQPTFQELQLSFDKSLQGSLNVIELFDDAKKIKDCSKRYFLNENDIINLKDGNIVVVCTQWGIFNINKFIVVAKKLGFDIQNL